jgi:hypothetical protein
MIGKLKNGYFIDSTSGLAFYLNLVNMGTFANDLDKVRDEINRVNGLIAEDANSSLATVGFHEPVWLKANADHQAIAQEIGSKSRPFVYLPKQVASPEEVAIPAGFFEKGFVWNGSNENVWTGFNSNELAHRYKSISVAQVPETPPVVVEPIPGGNDPKPVNDIYDLEFARFECLKWAIEIEKQNTSGVLVTEQIIVTADKLMAWIKK